MQIVGYRLYSFSSLPLMKIVSVVDLKKKKGAGNGFPLYIFGMLFGLPSMFQMLMRDYFEFWPKVKIVNFSITKKCQMAVV